MTKEKLRKELVEWLKVSAETNDTASDTWREDDAEQLFDYTYWMPNGIVKCLECSDEDAEFIEENDDFFEDAVKEAMNIK